MPFRTKNTYTTPDGGQVNTKKHTYTGPGRAPAGTRKVRAKKASKVPTVTTSAGGRHVTTSGFSSRAAAATAKRKARRSRTRVRRIEHAVSREEAQRRRQALALSKPSHRQPASPESYESRPTHRKGRSTMVSEAPSPATEPVAFSHPPAKSSAPRLKGTPPQRRRVRRKLQGAKRDLRHTPTLEGPLQPDQRRFDEEVAKRTKLNPRAVGAQSLAEESGSAAAQRQAAGDQNWLNIGPGAQLAPTPKGAAKETAELMNTGSSYAGIRASRGKGPQAQIAAIAASPWGTVGSTMQGTLPLVSISPAKREAKARVGRLTAKAHSLGMKTGAAPGVHGAQQVGPPPRKLVKRVVVAEHAMKEIEGQPYVWGGGHGSFFDYGKDCSGAVGYVLHALKVTKRPLTSGEMGSVLKPGPGALTVFYNPEHTFLRYVNRKGKVVYWGTSVGDSGAGGLTRHSAPSAAYLAQYSVGHVPGMGRKQALQLGVSPALLEGGQTVAGMAFSSDGTTATIASGGTRVIPGGSSRPIKLGRGKRFRQTARQILNKLDTVEAGVEEEPSATSNATGSKTLSALERKYGKAAV